MNLKEAVKIYTKCTEPINEDEHCQKCPLYGDICDRLCGLENALRGLEKALKKKQ